MNDSKSKWWNICKKRKNRWNLIAVAGAAATASAAAAAHSLAISYARLWAEFLFSDCINFVKFGIGVLSFLSFSVFGVWHACMRAEILVTARLYTADCKMRLTNPFVYLEFCGWLTDWRPLLLLLLRWLLLLLVQHHRCTTFIRRTDLFYMCLHRPFLFHFFFYSLGDGGVAHTHHYCCGCCCVSSVHSFILSFISFRFISLRHRLRRRFSFIRAIIIIIIVIFQAFALSPFLSVFLQRYSVPFISTCVCIIIITNVLSAQSLKLNVVVGCFITAF